MLLMAAGVKKSLIFNNILNAINLAVWVFVMTAGLFYINTDNWTKHGGFLPYGWSGVSHHVELFAFIAKLSVHSSCERIGIFLEEIVEVCPRKNDVNYVLF